MDARTIDRALGAFAGVALGDATGMPTQTLSRERIAALYGDVTDFRDAALGQPVCAGLEAATITDDMEQSCCWQTIWWTGMELSTRKPRREHC